MEVNGSEEVSCILLEQFAVLVLALEPVKHEAREARLRDLGVALH